MVLTAIAVAGRKVSVTSARVFMAELSCRVSSATRAVALASLRLSMLSVRACSAILCELLAI
jgi:hypothetical protein